MHDNVIDAAASKLFDLQEFCEINEVQWKIQSLSKEYDSLFARFCPFKLGDRIKLAKTPEISKSVRPGWLGSKHWMVEGVEGVVTNAHTRDGIFRFGIVFDKTTGLDHAEVEHPHTSKSIFYLKEDYLTNA